MNGDEKETGNIEEGIRGGIELDIGDMEADIAGGEGDVTEEDIGERTESGEESGKSNKSIGREGTVGRTK